MNSIKFPLRFYWSWKCWNVFSSTLTTFHLFYTSFPSVYSVLTDVSLRCAMNRVFFSSASAFPLCPIVSSYAILTAFPMSNPIYVFVWQIKVLKCSISALKIGWIFPTAAVVCRLGSKLSYLCITCKPNGNCWRKTKDCRGEDYKSKIANYRLNTANCRKIKDFRIKIRIADERLKTVDFCRVKTAAWRL